MTDLILIPKKQLQTFRQ